MNPSIFGETPFPPVPVGTFESFPPFGEEAQRIPQSPELAAKIERLHYEVQEWMKSVNLRLEKSLQKVQNVEARFIQLVQEVNERQAFIMSRVKERQGADFKVEALIERHNQIVQSFDLRLNQAQKIIENQSLQLAKQQEIIDDARRQIEKLKRL